MRRLEATTHMGNKSHLDETKLSMLTSLHRDDAHYHAKVFKFVRRERGSGCKKTHGVEFVSRLRSVRSNDYV